ncbi:MAG: hypothetical protein JNM68_07680 [Dinghuibacter sp.]|nr:hypothetical protein [Dinghuibacter sp.]
MFVKKLCPLLFMLLSVLITGSAVAQDTVSATRLTVVIVRHGEKPPKGDNLSCQGFNRSKLLPPVLYKACGGAPGHTYVPTMSTGKKTGSVRMFQTVTPFAVQYNLTINSKYAETDTVKVTQDVMTKNGVVLMVWEHTNIPGLARNFGITGEDLTWKGTDFDSMWIISFPTGGGAPTLVKTQEGLKPSANCK